MKVRMAEDVLGRERLKREDMRMERNVMREVRRQAMMDPELRR